MKKAEVHYEAQIRAAVDAELAARATVDLRVIEARRHEVSWRVIAEAVGMSRQATTKRFMKVPEIAQMEGWRRR